MTVTEIIEDNLRLKKEIASLKAESAKQSLRIYELREQINTQQQAMEAKDMEIMRLQSKLYIMMEMNEEDAKVREIAKEKGLMA